MAGPTATTPAVWLKADAGVYQDAGVTLCTNGTEFAQWNDQSGNGNNATMTAQSGFTYATNQLNSLPALNYPGSVSGHTLELANYWFSAPHTLFIVWKQSALVSYTVAVGGDTAANMEYGTDNSSPAKLAFSETGTATSASNLTMSAGTWQITCWRGGGRDVISTKAGNTAQAAVRVNGVPGVGMALPITANGVNSYIGASKGTAAVLHGQIAEVILYSSILAHSEVQQIEAYLGGKWGITVSVDPPFSFSTTSFNQWAGTDSTPLVVVGGSGAFDAGIVEVSCIYQEAGVYYVYYTGWNAAVTVGEIGLASGTSLTALVKQGVQVSPSGAPSWCGGYVSGANVFKFGSTYYCYFFGSGNTGFEATPADIGVATASSPTGPWTIETTPLLTPGSSGAWDDATLYRPYVVNNVGTYYLYYNAKHAATSYESIGYATASAPDGTYTKYASNPVIANGGGSGWTGTRVFDPCIFTLVAGSSWFMFFNGQTGSGAPAQVGLASSTNLSTWTLYSGNPIAFVGGNGVVIRPSVFNDAADGKWKATADDIYEIFLVQNDITNFPPALSSLLFAPDPDASFYE